MRRIRRHLHWWTAALVAIGFLVAWVMTALPLSVLLLKFLLYQLHKNIGLIVAGLAALRLILAFRAGDRIRGLKASLYALLLIVPLLGYLTAVTSPNPVPTLFLLLWNVPHPPLNQNFFEVIRPLHKWFAIGLIALAVWHAAPTWYRRR